MAALRISGLALVAWIGSGIVAPLSAGDLVDRHPRTADHAAHQQTCTPGHADLAFGVNGWAATPGGDGANALRDGRIAVLGRSNHSVYDSYQYSSLTSSGAPAADVGTVPVRAAAGPLTTLSQALVDDEDRLVLVGGVGRAPSYARPILLRRTGDGQPDRSFGRGGEVRIPRSKRFRYGTFYAATLLRDGSIAAAGDADGRLMVARFTSSGRLDRRFGDGGVSVVARSKNSYHETATGISALPGGALLVSGEARRVLDDYADDVRVFVARIASTGRRVRGETARTRFGTNGDVGGQAKDARGAWITAVDGNGRLALARVTRQGRFDTRVGRTGVQMHKLTDAPDAFIGSVAGAVIVAGGRVLVAATAYGLAEIHWPDGTVLGTRREMPIVAVFDSRGRRAPSPCPAIPALPAAAWAAELTSIAPSPNGPLISALTSPQPRQDDDEDGDGVTNPKYAPAVLRALWPR